MLNLTKSNVALTALMLSLPVALFFQNCGQPGSIASSGGEVALDSIIKTSDVMLIKPPSEQIDSSSSSGPTSHNDIHLDDPIDDDASSPKGSVGQCGEFAISDILLSVASISAHSDKPNDVSFEILDSDKSISLDKLSLKIKALKSEKLKEVFLLLSAHGNKILSSTNVAMDLKTPSAQQSGLKVKLEEIASVEADQSYLLELVIVPSEQIIGNKNKCIFRPVLRSAKLVAL